MSTHIVAMSAGRATMERADDPLHAYVLGLVDRPRPRVAFVATASGDDASYITAFYETFHSGRCAPTHVPLFYRKNRQLRDSLLSQDIIHVGGGNTANLLEIWRVHRVDEIMREAWESGVVLCGGGAGAMCWFEAGISSSFGISEPQPVTGGLGFLPGSLCPHFDIEPLREPVFMKMIGEGSLPTGYALDDDVGLHFVDGQLELAIASHGGARALVVQRDAAGPTMNALPVVDLSSGRAVASPWYRRSG